MKFLFTLLFACFSITLSAQFDTGTSSTQAQQLYQNALGQEKTGNLHQAKQLLKQALHEDPSFIEAMNSLAEVFRNLEMIDSTIYYLKTSLKLYPRGLDAHQNLAAAFQIKGDYEAAINQYHELLDHYPNYPQAYYGMALINYNRRQFPESIQGSEQAIRLFQISNSSVNASDARMLAGQAYMKIGDYPTAIKYFKASKETLRGQTILPLLHGILLPQIRKKEKAGHFLSQAEVMGYKIPQYVKTELEGL